MPPPKRSRAQAATAPADPALAHRLLAQAERHLASASVKGVDRDSRYGLLYDAARKAADAAMRAAGRRVTQGAGHHVASIAEAERLLGREHRDLWLQVEAARSVRNDREYRAREVSESELAALRAAAEAAIRVVREYVDLTERSRGR